MKIRLRLFKYDYILSGMPVALRLVEALTVVTIVAFLVVCSICVVFADYLFRILLLLIWVCVAVERQLHSNNGFGCIDNVFGVFAAAGQVESVLDDVFGDNVHLLHQLVDGFCRRNQTMNGDEQTMAAF